MVDPGSDWDGTSEPMAQQVIKVDMSNTQNVHLYSGADTACMNSMEDPMFSDPESLVVNGLNFGPQSMCYAYSGSNPTYSGKYFMISSINPGTMGAGTAPPYFFNMVSSQSSSNDNNPEPSPAPSPNGGGSSDGGGSCPYGDWVRSNHHSHTEWAMDPASTPADCIEQAQAAGCSVANLNVDAFENPSSSSTCWCQCLCENGSCPTGIVSQPDAGYYSCQVAASDDDVTYCPSTPHDGGMPGSYDGPHDGGMPGSYDGPHDGGMPGSYEGS